DFSFYQRRYRVHLANIMRKIRVMPDVIKVTRNRN
ncbi:hypothetical protein LTSEMIN_5526, partial [Salmonella enterica subsp. enterica serovar Minnesota str. A4-603]